MAVKEKDAQASTKPDEEGKKKPAGMKSYIRIFKYADGISRVLYTVSFIAAIASGTALPIMQIIFGKFVTTFNDFAVGTLDPGEYMNEVEKFTLYFVYLFIAKFILLYTQSICVSLAAIRTTKALRMHFLQSLLRQDMSFFDSEDAGSPSVKVTTNGNLVNNGISDRLSMTIHYVTTFFAAFVVAFAVQWKLTLITIAIIPVIIIVTGGCIALDFPQETKVSSAYSRAATLAEEVFSTISTVHAFWLQPLMAQRYDSLLTEAEHEGMKRTLTYGVLFSTQFFCVYSGYALAFWQGIRMYASGEITQPGKIVTVIFALILAATSMGQIAMQIITVGKATSAASELFHVIDKESEIDPMSVTGLIPGVCTGHLEIQCVTFGYPSRPESRVLENITLDIPAKKTTALVGASGSGKSTIVGLLDRWYDQNEGTIFLDGVDIRQLNVKWLRTRIRIVQQEPILFSGTVFENVANGLMGTEHETASQEKKMDLVQDACKAAFAHDFIEQLPQQYFTQIGERASMLSGGQCQRIAIARSIISNPLILLLDEATSALDPSAQNIVQKALDNVSKNCTTLTIAHNFSTVQRADNIAVISRGTVVEQGTHRELLIRNGAYARLVRAQSLEVATEKAPKQSGEHPEDEGHTDDVEPVEPKIEMNDTAIRNTKDKTSQQVVKESTDYSLIRCLFILIKEQSDLWPLYFLLSLSSICAGGTWPALAVLFSRMLRTFQLQGSAAVHEGNFWALMFFIVAIANLIIYFSTGVLCNLISQKVTHRYRLETFNNTIKQDMPFFSQETNATGAIVSRLSTCATDLQELLGQNSGIILNNIVTVIACAVLGIAYGWKLGLVCSFGALPLLMLSGCARIRLESKLEDDTAKRFASSAALAAEVVTAIRTVASLTLEDRILREYQDRLSNVASKSKKALIWTMFWYSVSQSINFLAMALGFWYGGKLVSTGEYSTQQFFVVFIAIIIGGENAAQFFIYSTSITKATKAANYIFWLRNRAPAIPEEGKGQPNDKEKDPDQPMSIGCNGVEFAYPSRPDINVVKNIDVNVSAGKFVAFVGPSNCGKSTMISLLSRFYDPTSGVIKVNTQPITNIGPREHRRRLAIVQQEPVLYSGSIRENVAMGMIESAEPTESQIEEALKNANVLEFFQSLPEGLETPLGNRGTQLSGGQRQRVAIARALIRDPKILLLDEATSALDTESEKIVQATLANAARDGRRSTVAVAHRLSTIRDADIIFVFHAGQIIEFGPHATLLARKSTYFKMCEAQALDVSMID